MKNLITFICLMAFSFMAQAQEPTKYQKGRAALFSTYIADKMDLNEEQENLVYNVMLERVVNANAKIKANKDISKEEKQAIYKAEFSNAQNKLAAEFGEKQARKMMLLSNEARKNADKQ